MGGSCTRSIIILYSIVLMQKKVHGRGGNRCHGHDPPFLEVDHFQLFKKLNVIFFSFSKVRKSLKFGPDFPTHSLVSTLPMLTNLHRTAEDTDLEFYIPRSFALYFMNIIILLYFMMYFQSSERIHAQGTERNTIYSRPRTVHSQKPPMRMYG